MESIALTKQPNNPYRRYIMDEIQKAQDQLAVLSREGM